MKPAPFRYARASSLDEALSLLDEAGGDAKLLAGGQSLIPLMAFRIARPSHLVDITRVPGLDGIVPRGGLTIGALVRHAELERSNALRGPWQALREAAAQIGHHPIRVRGTFGGNMAHADPAAELPVVATALDATFLLRSACGAREVPAAEFFAGPHATLLEPGEALVEARFASPAKGLRSGFEEFSPRAGALAFASAAVALSLDSDGRATQVRVALGAVGPRPARSSAAEAAIEGSLLTDAAIGEAAREAAAACDPVGDRHAGARFRRELVGVLVARTLRRLREQA